MATNENKKIIHSNYCEHSWVFDKSRSNYSRSATKETLATIGTQEFVSL